MPRLASILICVFFLIFISWSSEAQDLSSGSTISFFYNNKPLDQALLDLQSRYNLNFSYSNSQVSLKKTISCSANSLTLEKALQAFCSCSNLTFQIIGEQIVLKPKTAVAEKPILKTYTQTLRGTVLDAGLKTPLIGATVILLSVDPSKAVSTGIDGSFALEQLPIGRHSIKVKYLGYKDGEVSNIMVVSGKETIITVQLEVSLIEQTEVLVVGERDKTLPQNLLISSSVHTLRTEEINRFAGSRQDPSRMAANYAGVSSASDQRNDLIVRGNSPLGVLWRLEGVEIPNPNHFTFTPNTGGAISLLNNNLLANSDFLTGAFPAEYGNRIGAVMDVRLREGNNKKVENTLQLGLNGMEVVTEGPLVKKWGGSFLGSMRLFTFRPLEKLGVDIGYQGLPRYQDGSFKIVLPTPKSGKFSAWGIGGSSNVTIYDIDNDTTTWGKVRYRLEPTLENQMYAFGLHHTYTNIPKTVTELIVSTSGSQVEATSIATYRNRTSKYFYYLRNYEKQLITKFNITHKPNHRLLVKGGLSWQKMYYNNQEIMLRDQRDVYEIPLDAAGSASLLQGYMLAKYTLSPKFDVQTGIYSQKFSIGQRTAIEPRISLDYHLSDAQKLYLSAGLHSQTQPLVYYEYRFFSQERPEFNKPYNQLDFTRSRQLVLGYNYSHHSVWRFKAEAYYQNHFRVPVSKRAGEEAFSMLNLGTDYSFVTVDSVVSAGTGRNYGIEFTAERFLKDGFYTLGNLSLLKSDFTGGDGKVRPTAFSIGFISNLLVGKEFNLDTEKRHHLSFDLRINYAGGRRYIPIDSLKTGEEQSDKIYYDVTNAYNEQLKNYFRTDARVSYQLNTQKSTHWIFAAADNFLNNKNELYHGWDMEQNKKVTYYQIGIYPYLGYRIQF